jgi:DNA-directed RNA polymerase specialized sigma24 family protein
VLTLSRVLGLSNAQIAVELGKSDGAVRTLLSRALVRLSALLDETPA